MRFIPAFFLSPQPAYVSMSEQLNQTTRHIAYLCSWPFYMLLNRQMPPWDEIRRRCNMWRVADDVNESLGSILNIIATYERLQVRIRTPASENNLLLIFDVCVFKLSISSSKGANAMRTEKMMGCSLEWMSCIY